MITLRLGTFCVLLLACLSVKADLNDFNKINPDAPKETRQFEPLLGDWAITDFNLTADGIWQQGKGADWHWYTILDGYAIQDDWIAPSVDTHVSDSERQYGTNIRIYNPRKQQWEMAWMSKKGQQLDTFTAEVVNGNIVMLGLFAGNQSRITFYDIHNDSFQWKLEFKTDAGWKEVYRISAKRKK